jgi:hypothetical protein
VADRIRDEVREYLTHAISVDAEHELWGTGFELDSDASGARRLAALRHNLVQECIGSDLA